MAKDIVITCQHCGKPNRFYAPSPEQLGANHPNKFKSKEFQSTSRAFDYGKDDPDPPARSPRRGGFWHSEAMGHIKIGSYFGLVTYAGSAAYHLPDALGYGIGSALTVSGGLALLGLMAKFPVRPPKPKSEKPKETTIKTELRTQRSDGKWDYVFDELRDKGVDVSDLEKAAKAIFNDPDLPGVKRLSVKSITKQGMSYNHARKVLAELQEREWVTTRAGNKTIVTMYRGAPFLEKLLK